MRTGRFTHVSADFSDVVFLHEYVEPESCGLGGQARDEGLVRQNGQKLYTDSQASEAILLKPRHNIVGHRQFWCTRKGSSARHAGDWLEVDLLEALQAPAAPLHYQK